MVDTLHDLPVTIAIPVKNEEANLSLCLERLKGFPDIVVIDSGSSDRTVEIANSYGARVIQFDWNGQFPKKRNWFLMNHPPERPWVLFLDADEYIDDQFRAALIKATDDPTVDGYWLRYSVHFLGKRLRYGVQQRKLALFRVHKGLYEQIDEDRWSQLDMEIHEHPIIDGKIAVIDAQIDHRDYKGLGKFIERHRDYAQWEAQRYLKLSMNADAWSKLTRRQLIKYRLVIRWWFPTFYFCLTYFGKLGFLDGAAGYQYAAYKAWYFRTIRLLICENSET